MRADPVRAASADASTATLERLWETTNAAARELDGELTMPLSLLVQEAIRALEQRPFGARIEHLARKHHKATRHS